MAKWHYRTWEYPSRWERKFQQNYDAIQPILERINKTKMGAKLFRFIERRNHGNLYCKFWYVEKKLAYRIYRIMERNLPPGFEIELWDSKERSHKMPHRKTIKRPRKGYFDVYLRSSE